MHQGAHDQAGAGGDAGEGVPRRGLPLAQFAAQALGLGLSRGRQFGLPRLFLAEPHDGGGQRGQRGGRVRALRGHAQLRATPGTQAQQSGHALGVGHRVAAPHVHPRLEAPGHAGPLAGRPRMEPAGVIEGEFAPEREILQRRALGPGARGAPSGASAVSARTISCASPVVARRCIRSESRITRVSRRSTWMCSSDAAAIATTSFACLASSPQRTPAGTCSTASPVRRTRCLSSTMPCGMASPSPRKVLATFSRCSRLST